MSHNIRLVGMTVKSPENADVPLSSEAMETARKKLNWLKAAGIISVIIGVIVLSTPLWIRSHRAKGSPEVLNNARQIGLALFEFQTEYGSLPDKRSISKVSAKNSSDLHLGTTTSNDFFRQLIAANIVQSEGIFYAKIKDAQKPDNIMTAGEAIKKGECGFSYLAGLTASGNTPLLVTPLIPGTDRFDPEPFEGKAMILKRDNSVTSLPIREDGHVWIDGMNFLDPNHPIWAGKPPVIAYPE